MNTRRFFTLLLTAGTLASSATDAAAVDPPGILNHQGRIAVAGTNYDGTGYFKFAMTSAAGSASYWSNDGTSAGGGEPANGVPVTVSAGHYAVPLGDTGFHANMNNAIAASVFTDNADVRLKVWFSTDDVTYEELTPKRRIASAAYALSANKAQNVMSGSVSDLSFLGTTTATPFALSVNNTTGLRLEYPTSGSVPNLIGGYSGNSISAGSQGSVIAGGGSSSSPNAVTGGASDASIGGGRANTVSGNSSTVGGGFGNTASGGSATVGGGSTNTASGLSAAVVGGQNNTASGSQSTVGGGQLNTASGGWSTVPGGRSNEASGSYSLAAGRRAKANHLGAFVWADSENADFASTGADQFLIRAAGGVGIGTASPNSWLHVNGDGVDPSLRVQVSGNSRLTVATNGGVSIGGFEDTPPGNGLYVSGNTGIGTASPANKLTVQTATSSFGIEHTDGTRRLATFLGGGANAAQIGTLSNHPLLFFVNGSTTGLFVNTAGNVGVGTTGPTAKLSVNGTANNGTGVWGVFSDRRLKENIAPMEAGSLERLLKLEGMRYDYTREDLREGYEHTHRGWVAQEVEEVFPEWVSEAPDGMKMVTPVGFRALTVEALRELREEKDAAIEELEEENAALKERLERLEKVVGRLTTNGHE